MRVFVALVLPESFKHALVEATSGLCSTRNDLRWIRASRLHLTLAFLGDLDDRGTDIAVEAAERAAAESRPFTLTASGLLALPRRGAARVLAASVGEGSAEATALADCFERALADLGRDATYAVRPREARPFTAHITLARAGRASVKFSEDELIPATRASGLTSAMAVYESLLGAGEATYREIARVELGAETYAK